MRGLIHQGEPPQRINWTELNTDKTIKMAIYIILVKLAVEMSDFKQNAFLTGRKKHTI